MTLNDLDVSGKKVLVRVDFNVPLNANHQITDDTRIKKALPTISHLLERGARVILCSHLGRPQKKKLEDGSIDVNKFTLRHVVDRLAELTQATVHFSPETVGAEAEIMSDKLQDGEILLVENTRFDPGETTGDRDLALKLSRLADVYVNDAFGTAHRAHASTAVVAEFFEDKDTALGFLMAREIQEADKVMNSPQRPFTAIVGGAKVSDKIKLIDRLIEKANHVIIGGGMAYTFVKAQGGQVGNSICEDDYTELALSLLDKAKRENVEIHLPTDVKIADKFSPDANTDYCPVDQIPDGWEGLDAGPNSIIAFKEVILNSKTILWNGPLGVFEFDAFANGTDSIAEAVGEATRNGAYSLIGGGDSVSAINKAGLADEVSHVSTGGGAMLEYLEGKTLPGIKAITG
jgi:phosphoglycerate kinase